MVRGTYHGNNYVIVPCASQESERQHTDTLGSPVFECIRKKDISISSTTDSTLDTCTNLEKIFEFESVWKNILFLNLVRIILSSVVIEGSNQTHSCEVINQDHSCNRSKVDKG